MDAPYIQQVSFEEGVRIGSSAPSLEYQEKIRQFLKEDGWIIQECTFVVWTSSAMGVAEQGHHYLCVMTPGYKVTLQKEDQLVVLHTDVSGDRMILVDFI